MEFSYTRNIKDRLALPIIVTAIDLFTDSDAIFRNVNTAMHYVIFGGYEIKTNFAVNCCVVYTTKQHSYSKLVLQVKICSLVAYKFTSVLQNGC